jgi:hypothetical protein
MWDTGIEDAIAEEPGGQVIAHNRRIIVRRIRCQLADIGIAPADVGKIILSPAHFPTCGGGLMALTRRRLPRLCLIFGFVAY